jgi:hypothetical protein
MSNPPPDLPDLPLAPVDNAPTVITTTRGRPTVGVPTLESVQGRRLGHFELEAPVGVGGMAAVIRARDLQLNRVVALKILPPELATDPESVVRFKHEAQAAARLDHENIARVYFCGEDQGLHFIAFEFVAGDNLRQLIERHGTIPVEECLHYLHQVAAGLAHAAQRGVVHRDIKPSNILITPEGRAKIVDMGLARHLDTHAVGGVTQSGVTLGTFDYISPEQALDPRQADVRSDLYSLGCTFYHALTGRPPVPEGTAAKKLHAHQHVAPLDPRQLNPSIPDGVASLLAKLMAKLPTQRPQSAEQLMEQVQRLLAAGLTAPVPSMSGAGPIAPVALIVGVVVLALLALWATQPPPSVEVGPHWATVSAPTTLPTPPVPVTVPTPTALATPAIVTNVAELQAALRTSPTVVRLAPGNYDLRADTDAVLNLTGTALTLEAADATQPPTLRLYDGGTALALSGTAEQPIQVTLRNLRWVQAGPQASVAVRISAASQVLLDGCEWSADTSATTIGVRVVANGGVPVVNLTACGFLRGSVGVDVIGSATVSLSECALGPLTTAAVRVRPGGGGETLANVRLEHCSALLDMGAVVQAEDGANVRVEAGHCLWAAPASGRAAVVRQTGTSAGGMVLRNLDSSGGRPNGYFQVQPFRDDTTTTPTKPTADANDAGQIRLRAAPWQTANAWTTVTEQPRLAFAINLTYEELRVRGDAKNVVLGINRYLRTGPDLYLRPLPEAKTSAALPVRVVDPNAPFPTPAGTFRKLTAAVVEANPGDIIEIRHTGPLLLEPTELRFRKADMHLTLRPAPDCQPILQLDESAANDADSALFRLSSHGTLTLEDLHLRLQPGRTASFTSQSIATITNDAQVICKRCTITLAPEAPFDEDGCKVRLAVVTLTDGVRAQRPNERRGTPQVRLDRCVVRGHGDLLTVVPGRGFALHVEQTLAALSGSGIRVEGAVNAGATGTVHLVRSTFALGKPVLNVGGKDGEGKPLAVVGVALHAHECLFASQGAGALVTIDGVDGDEQARQLLKWEARDCVYDGKYAAAVLDLQTMSAQQMPLAAWDAKKWLAWTREAGEPFKKVQFALAPLPRSLVNVRPADFRVRFTDWKGSEVDAVAPGAAWQDLPTSAR